MSQAKDILFSILTPKVEAFGYRFVKAKNGYSKRENDIWYKITSSWDGRGGISCINHFSGEVSLAYVEKITKSMFDIPYNFRILEPSFFYFDENIPQMFSKKMLETSSLKTMSKIPFDEKYPMARIKNTADYIERKILQEIIPFHQTWQSEGQILEALLKNIGERYAEGAYFGLIQDVAVAKIILKKMKIEEPDFIRAIEIFSKQTEDESWNMQEFDVQKSKKMFLDQIF